MSEKAVNATGDEAAARRARVAHLLEVSGNLSIAIMALWGNSPRAEAMLGMCEASLRYSGPDRRDDKTLEELRALFSEAREYRKKENFPATMARLRVAYDVVSLAIIRASGE
ncbi:Hypothetical Protein RradSPS_1032 [Rubrobacter radiotolerans]|uniref:Uncharacterized protein n=1 Tax=Rubrobacter radiotolerans TaxID=42256 RepID=A0A023X2T2_RUBRA|nr:hypothetical protein [Rubrobacter radiotolerans]AHY46315.1 Hypothetical Protein RradSPS_1032 [Rubrobacter radiotolerans]MDX5893722.1 hypothetical protein [Rubrobacter radiotolerans]SMC04355.1 conserved hypothetical protein [Rubrobacter radiotolerans DSM 5868]